MTFNLYNVVLHLILPIYVHAVYCLDHNEQTMFIVCLQLLTYNYFLHVTIPKVARVHVQFSVSLCMLRIYYYGI